jgi:hypothetical protein
MAVDSRPAHIDDERDPLILPSSKPPIYNDQPYAEATSNEENTLEVTVVKPEPVKWSVWSITFYITLAAFGAFLLVVIIKGFVDTKDPNDVDVRFISSSFSALDV